MSAVPSSTTEFSIRACRPEESPTLSEFAKRLFVQAYGPTHPEPELSRYLARTYDPACLSTDLAAPDIRVFLAESSTHELLGYAYLRKTRSDAPEPVRADKSCEILRFYVDESWHGRGVASALMDECARTTRDWGADVLWVDVWTAAARPIAFYKKAGFAIVGTAPFYFGERVDEDYVMSRRLDSPALVRS